MSNLPSLPDAPSLLVPGSSATLNSCPEDPKQELTDSVLSILSRLVHDGSGSGRSAIGVHLDVGANDGTGGAEEVLEILPADVKGDLMDDEREGEEGGRGREAGEWQERGRKRSRRGRESASQPLIS